MTVVNQEYGLIKYVVDEIKKKTFINTLGLDIKIPCKVKFSIPT